MPVLTASLGAELNSDHEDVIHLENRFLTLELDAYDGHIITLRNKLRGLDLVSFKDLTNEDRVPWRLGISRLGMSQTLQQVISFSYNLSCEAQVTITELKWEADFSISIEARILLIDDDPNIYFYINTTNNGSEEIVYITYPIIPGIGYLGNNLLDDNLAYPFTTGYLFHEPYNLFNANQGLRSLPYPNGFGGTTMQFMVYYSETEKGGFYLATHDPYETAKYFDFYKSSNNIYLICSFTHKSWDIHPNNHLVLGYPVVLGALFEGNWYEGAERYREWATQQSWCAMGPLWERVEEGLAARWLVENVGFCTFGIVSFLHNVSSWLDGFHNIADIPVFHVLGHDWAADRAWVDPIDRPVSFNKDNIDATRRNGDFFSPFGFDLFTGNETAQISPYVDFPYGCPITQYMHNAYKKWNLWVLNQSDADSRYNDIGASSAPIYCNDVSHGHPEGYGRWMIDAYRELMNETKQALIDSKGRYVPIGTEVIHELFVDVLDFYQMRASAGPQTDMEGQFFLGWELNHNCEKIPLFNYVYHEYGPIGMDGFAKISEKFGDIFYWIAARVALWGDLLELNYEFSSLEMFPGMTGSSGYLKYHYQWMNDPNPLEADPKKLEFLREIANARTGFAKDYLAYGKMTRPPKILTPIPTISLSFNHYNDIDGSQDFRSGQFDVSTLVTQAYIYKGKKLGILFVNLQEEPMNITFEIDPERYGLPIEETYRYSYVARGIWKTLKTDSGQVALQIELPPRRVMLVEVEKNGSVLGAIQGRVNDENDTTISEAHIRLHGSNGYNKTTVTAVNGCFQIDEVPAGIFNMTIEKTGFINQTVYCLVIEPNKTRHINVTMLKTMDVFSVGTTGIVKNVTLENDQLHFTISVFDNSKGVLDTTIRKRIVSEKGGDISKLKIYVDGKLVETMKSEIGDTLELRCIFNWTMSEAMVIISFTGNFPTPKTEHGVDLAPYYIVIGIAILTMMALMLIKRRVKIRINPDNLTS